MLASLVILAFQDLTKGAFANELFEFKSVADLVARDNAVVSFTVIEAIINEAFKLGWLVFLVGLGQVPDFVVLVHLRLLVNRQKRLGFCVEPNVLARYRELEPRARCSVHYCDLLPLCHFWDRCDAVIAVDRRALRRERMLNRCCLNLLQQTESQVSWISTFSISETFIAVLTGFTLCFLVLLSRVGSYEVNRWSPVCPLVS